MSVILFGQYPRSEDLVKASRDFDRGRIDRGSFDRQIRKDRASLLALQEGLPFLSSGLVDWDDLMRPFVEILQDVRAGALTRFYETNTFWRRIEVEGPLRLQEEKLEEWVQERFAPDGPYEGPLVFTLPFLYLFREFSKGAALPDIAGVLQEIAREIDRSYQGFLLFYEPALGWNLLDDAEKKEAYRFLETLKSEVTMPLGIVQCFFPIEREGEFLYSLPVDAIGIDFYSNRLNDVAKAFPKDKSLLAGVISTESTYPEKAEHLSWFKNEVSQFLPLDRLFFTTSGPAELLPREVMDSKLKNFRREEL